MNDDIARDATDLTQLSSREQLSALMDGALPADETRFLLRRLRHDASLAECWERWRLSAEVMRGLAPAQRLPADFASRVAAALHGDVPREAARHAASPQIPGWLRWGGGAAMAASLAVAAVVTTRPAPVELPAGVVAATDPAPSRARAPLPRVPRGNPAGDVLQSQAAALATAVAVAARPARSSRRLDSQASLPQPGVAEPARVVPFAVGTQAADTAAIAASELPALLPRGDVATHAWPRSVLPQFGNNGLTVGFGDSARGAAAFDPFQLRSSVGGLHPTLMTPAADDAAESAAPDNPERTSDDQPPHS